MFPDLIINVTSFRQPTTVTIPVIDKLNARTFQYRKIPATRGIFDEFMWYQWFPLRPEDQVVPDRPYQVQIFLLSSIDP
jgi:hypothetical protein